MCRHSVPAIWLYPEVECDVDVSLTFHGGGFLIVSTPPYQDKWRIHVDPSIPFARYKERYGFQSYFEFLDYDGIREGPYQFSQGWCVPQNEFMSWLQENLLKLGFTDNEIGSVVYYYGRMLMDNKYPGKYLYIWPQNSQIVDKSVSLTISPTPDSVYRIWFYLQFSDTPKQPEIPNLDLVVRKGFTVTEVGFLTRRDIPSLRLTAGNSLAHGLLPYWVAKTRF